MPGPGVEGCHSGGEMQQDGDGRWSQRLGTVKEKDLKKGGMAFKNFSDKKEGWREIHGLKNHIVDVADGDQWNEKEVVGSYRRKPYRLSWRGR